jgi:SAM-dependent methyltransferase
MQQEPSDKAISDSRRAAWCQKWSHDGPRFWKSNDRIPEDAKNILSTFAHVKRKRILDIGCGSGLIASNLADFGHEVVGVDFSGPAITLAKETWGSLVQFYELDFLFPNQDLGQFDILLDRGCLHGMPLRFRQRYFKTASQFANQDSMLIVVHKLGFVGAKNTTPIPLLIEDVSTAANAYFLLDKTENVAISGGAKTMPCVAFYFRRR